MKIDSLTVLNLSENDSLQNVPNGIVGHPGIRKLYVNGTVVSKMSAEMQQNLQGVIDTVSRSPDDITVIEYSPSKAPHIEKVRNDREKVYKMTSKPKGLALIFEVVTYYCDMDHPTGSDVDVQRLLKLFKGIGYNVRVIRDPLSARHFETQLKDLLATHAVGDSVIVAVLARASNEGMICCNGDIFSVNEMVSILGNADIYLGKPKLIFIQASRDSRSSHFRIRQDEEREDSDSSPLGIPAHSHVLIDYVTLPGFASHRNLRKGSWYIQSLVEVFSKHAFQDDVLTLLTLVNSKVSRKFKTMQGQNTLKRKLFFLPGYFEDDDHCSAASTST